MDFASVPGPLDVASVPILFILALWTVVTFLNTREDMQDFLSERAGDFSALIPGWKFFAPIPGQVDYHIYFRDQRVDGTRTPWRRVDRFGMTRKWYHTFWNPEVLRDKGLFDVVEQFTDSVVDENNLGLDPGDGYEGLTEEDDEDDGGVEPVDIQEELETVELGDQQTSVLYLSILNCVTQEEHSDMSAATQFAIMANSRHIDDHEPVFVSKFHKLEQ